MKKIKLLEQIKELIDSMYLRDEIDTIEYRALEDIVEYKGNIIEPIIGGYKTAHFIYDNEVSYLELKYNGAKAKITVLEAKINEISKAIEAVYSISKLSDYENTLSHYKYDSKKQKIEYETCSREKNGITNYKGIIERDNNSSNHVIGITRHYDYSLLESHIKSCDIKSVPISIVSNVVRASTLKFEPTYEEYVETLDGNIINLETKVNSDDNNLFRRGNVFYNADLEEKESKQLKK